MTLSGTNQEQIEILKNLLKESEIGLKGVEELEFVIENVESLGIKDSLLKLDVTLARGLNYYTGTIIEIGAPEGVSIGSIGGGGRYDDLTGIFGLKNMSGIGISFGLDRIYMVMDELDLFPKTIASGPKALFINFGEKEAQYAIRALDELRKAGIKAELFPDSGKMGKQMGYADKRKIPFTILAGEKEMETKSFTLRNMKTGAQSVISLEELKLELLKE